MVDIGISSNIKSLWSLPSPKLNVTWHSGTWPYKMTPSIDQTLHQFANLLPNWTWLPIFTLLPNFGGFHRTLQRVRLANRGRLLLQTRGPVPFGTCICSTGWDHSFLNLSCLRTFWVWNIPRYFYFALQLAGEATVSVRRSVTFCVHRLESCLRIEEGGNLNEQVNYAHMIW